MKDGGFFVPLNFTSVCFIYSKINDKNKNKSRVISEHLKAEDTTVYSPLWPEGVTLLPAYQLPPPFLSQLHGGGPRWAWKLLTPGKKGSGSLLTIIANIY